MVLEDEDTIAKDDELEVLAQWCLFVYVLVRMYFFIPYLGSS